MVDVDVHGRKTEDARTREVEESLVVIGQARHWVALRAGVGEERRGIRRKTEPHV